MLLVATLLGFVAMGGAMGGVAQAHSELVSTSPADGAVLDAPPTEVSFTYNEDLLPDFVKFVALDEQGATAELPVTSVEGPTAVVSWPETLPAGAWSIEYRVVSQDGHPINGAISFSYAGTSPSPATSSAVPTSAAPSPASTSAEPEPTPDLTSMMPSPSTSPAADTGDTNSGWIIAGIAVAVLAVIAVVGLVARSRSH